MFKTSAGRRLYKLRKDAIKRGVFDNSVYPRRTFGGLDGVAKYETGRKSNFASFKGAATHRILLNSVLSQREDDDIQEIIKKTLNINISPVLHPRPRHIYGDLYAPTYVTAHDEGSPRKAVTDLKRKFLIGNAKKCRSCSSGKGKRCTRLLPTTKGPAQALETLVLRKIHARPAQKRPKNALLLQRMSPGPSPLVQSFTPDGLAFCPTSRSRREFGMYIVKGGELVRVGTRGVFSPRQMRSDTTAVKPGSEVVSYVQGPIPAGWEEGACATSFDKVCSEKDSRVECNDGPRSAYGELDKQSAASTENNVSSLPFPTTPSARCSRSRSVTSTKGMAHPALYRRRADQVGAESSTLIRPRRTRV